MSSDVNGDQGDGRSDGGVPNPRIIPPPAANGWRAHIPNIEPSQLPRAPASFLYDIQTRDGTPTTTSSSPAYNHFLLDHHPTYALPSTFGAVQHARLRSATPGSNPYAPATTPNRSSPSRFSPPAGYGAELNDASSHVRWSPPSSSAARAHTHLAQERFSSPQIHTTEDSFEDMLWGTQLQSQRTPLIPQDVQYTAEVARASAPPSLAPELFHAPVLPIAYDHILHADPTPYRPWPAQQQQVQVEVGSESDDTEVEQAPGIEWPRRRQKRARIDVGEDDDPTPKQKRPRKGDRPRGRRKGEIRGPRPTMDPGEDFMKVYNEALDSFIEKRELERAQRLVLEAIGMNPEIFAAHSLLADIHFELGNPDLAIDALMVGLHGHINDVELWRQAADRILNIPQETYQKRVERAMYCFGAILRKDGKDTDARFQRAECARILGAWNRAFGDFHILLQNDPHNSGILAQFAVLCGDIGDLHKARIVYEEHFEYYKNAGPATEDIFTWQDVSVYIDLLSRGGETAYAIVMLRRLARQLMGREHEYYWEECMEDDREFDQNHYPRRLEESRFDPNLNPQLEYGEALPLDLRAKLGVLRLKLNFRDEAQSHFNWLEPDVEGEESLAVEYGDTFYEVAKALHEAKEHEQAMHFYAALDKEGIDLGLEFWMDMAASSYICGQKDKAVKCYERCVELDPNGIEAKTQLTKLYRDLGRRDMAIKYGNEAVIMAQGMIPQTMNRKYERRENRVARENAERALKNAFRMPKPGTKTAGKVPRSLRYHRRDNNRRFTWYIPAEGEEIQASFERRMAYNRKKKEKAKAIPPGSQSPASLSSPEARSPSVSESRSPSPTPLTDEEPPMYDRSIKVPRKPGRPKKVRLLKSKAPSQENAERHYEEMQKLYTTLLNHQDGMRNGDEVATNVWVDCAAAMVEDFRTIKLFYPGERSSRFEGYSNRHPQPRAPTPATNRGDDTTEDTGGARLSAVAQPQDPLISNAIPQLAEEPNVPRIAEEGLPDEYCDISFATWLDIFLELAILHANSASVESQEDCYGVINAAIDCNVFYHHEQTMVNIYTCYLACALALNDDLTIYHTVLRWFMREYAFCTDTYRLYSAISMVNEIPAVAGGKSAQMDKAVFKSAPNQKFIFRQLMSIDKMLPADYNVDGPEGGVPAFMRRHRDELRKLAKQTPADKPPTIPSNPVDRINGDLEEGIVADGTFAGTPAPSQPVDNTTVVKAHSPQEMDIVLFTLYSHMMMSSGSFTNSLSYLYRAYSLEPENCVVLLSMALCYLHELFKRQTGNRHSYALMGWVWFGRYEEARLKWAMRMDEKAEEARSQGREVYSDKKLVDVVKQEIEFNKARCWEMLGMADLGVRGYQRVLDMKLGKSDGVGLQEDDAQGADEDDTEDWSMEAAYAMSTLYALNGNGAKAREITEKYLVV